MNILAVFSEINKNNYLNSVSTDKNIVEILRNVFNDLRCYYKETKTNKKRIYDFKIQKFVEIEIHEIITRIFCNLSKTLESCHLIMTEEGLIDDIFEFIIKLAHVKKDNGNYIVKVIENAKKKKKNVDEAKKVIVLIVDNSILGLRNLLLEDNYKKLILWLQKKFLNEEAMLSVFSSLELNFKEHGIISNKITNLIFEIKAKLVNVW